MTYANQANKVGREPCYIVQLEVDRCSLSFGNAPCTATASNPDDKCYNTRATCEDPENYSIGTFTYNFCSDVLKPPRSCFPWIPKNGVRVTPVRTSMDGSIFENGTVSVRIADHPMHDRLSDKYWDERSVPGEQRSTFWKKWLARNKYYKGRRLVLLEGFLAEDGSWDHFKRSYWIIDSIEFSRKGFVQIKAKDILKQIWAKNAQCPQLSHHVLAHTLGVGASSFTVTEIEGYDIATDYGASGYIRIGKEVIKYTRSGYTFTAIERAAKGTTEEQHELGDSVQECAEISGTPADALYALLSTYAKIKSAYLPKGLWDNESLLWLPNHQVSALITEPEGVDTLVRELMLSCQFAVYWNQYLSRVEMKASQPAFEENSTVINDDAGLKFDSIAIKEQTGEQATQIWISYGTIDAAGERDKMSNYRRTLIITDSGAEAEPKYNTSQVKHFFTRWFDNVNDGAALSTAGKMLISRVDPPKRVTFEVDASKATLSTADLWRLSTRELVDANGDPVETPLFVTSAEVKTDSVEYECVSIAYNVGRSCRFMDEGTATPDYQNATGLEKATGGYYCDESTNKIPPSGEEGYTFI